MSRARKLLTADDIQGCWAIIPTPARDGADQWSAVDTLDVEETRRIVNAMIDAGVDGILSLGTLGECGALTWAEKELFMRTLVEAAAGRIPIFGGTTALGTREAIAQTRAARDIGLDGTMVGPSMWNKPDVAAAVRFYQDLAEAVPDMAICVYANPFVFKFDFPPPFWAQVAEIPQVVCAKVASYATLLRDTKAARGRIRFMPMDSEYMGAVKLDPRGSVAFWSSSASCGPAPAVALRDLVAQARHSGDWSAVEELSDEMGRAVLPIVCYGDFNLFQTHNVTLEKGRMNVAGWLKAGPNRPPYHLAPPQILEFAKLGGEAWAALQEKYASK
ncbi:dihydrodipicolinate synthase family protein [Paraburkholderia kururiensis]|uniref:dihydrodipicolinate synthase family protein n=1 Tax=Paraburkholderia kururiensis TaxID=984307 RepID=UPI00034609FE|nr:dihydrodipicolinate synthase family protein [Paraburkholderia kururiensis]